MSRVITYLSAPFGGAKAPEIWIRGCGIGEVVPESYVEVYTARPAWTEARNLRLKWEGTGKYLGDIARASVDETGRITRPYGRESDDDEIHFRIGTGKRDEHGAPIVDIMQAHAGIDIQLPRVEDVTGRHGPEGVWGNYPPCADCGGRKLVSAETMGGFPWAQNWHISGAYECMTCGSLYCDTEPNR